MSDLRLTQLTQWLNTHFTQPVDCLPLSGDAGFRRYFRVKVNGQSYIAVDAPSGKCNNQSFAELTHFLAEQQFDVPNIYQYAEEQGFFLLTDLGSLMFSDAISDVDDTKTLTYYKRAIDIALELATTALPTHFSLPDYDAAFIYTELEIFREWLLAKHLAIGLDNKQVDKLQACFDFLVQAISEQPKVVMHRDFHSRNLMATENSFAIIDYQDAVHGPLSYDLVSLLRDCYVKLPTAQLNVLFDYYFKRLTEKPEFKSINYQQLKYWFDLTGIQRHLKASGIFARLHHRDNKSNYLADIPQTLDYIVEVASQYDNLSFLAELVQNKVTPALVTMKNQEDQL